MGALAAPSGASAAIVYNFGFSGSVPVLLNVNTSGGLVVLSTGVNQFTPGIFNQGWWSADFGNGDTNDNYFVGDNGGPLLNNFFSFDTRALDGLSVIDAQLSLDAFDIESPGAGNDYLLFDVSTSAAVLNDNDGVSAAIFADLGSGTSYGSFFVAEALEFTTIGLSLNAAAIADLQAAADAGEFFSIGGTLDLGSNAVPEPTSLAIFGLGALGLAIARRARRKK